MVRNFIGLQCIAALFYITAASVAYYARIWRGLPIISQHVSFQIAQIFFIFFTEIALVVYVFLLWYRETIRVNMDRLTYDSGVLIRKHVAISLNTVTSAVYTQSLLGRLTHYGTVLLRDRNGSALIRLGGMPEPVQFVDRVLQLMGRTSTDPQAFVALPEHEKLERKSTFRWDIQRQTVNRSLEKSAMKTIAAFLNSGGGHLLLGVDDHGNAVGMTHDWATLPRKDADGFENHFSHVLSTMIGPTFRQHVQLQHFEHQGKSCLAVAVTPATRPAYVHEDGREEFFIRTGNGTTSLRLSEATDYMKSRFAGY